MLRLKGQTESGEWVEFEASSICRADKTYMIVWTGYDPYYELLLIETIQLADDPRKALSEQEVLTRVQAMGEESLSPDNFEGLMRALEALKITRNVDAGSEDPRKQMLDEIRERINNLCEYKFFVRVEGDPVPTLPQIAKWCVIWILDEMEAKL